MIEFLSGNRRTSVLIYAILNVNDDPDELKSHPPATIIQAWTMWTQAKQNSYFIYTQNDDRHNSRDESYNIKWSAIWWRAHAAECIKSLKIWIVLIFQAAVELLRGNAEQQAEAEFRW